MQDLSMSAVMCDDWFNLTRAARLQIPIEPVLGTDSLFQGCQQAGPGVTWYWLFQYALRLRMTSTTVRSMIDRSSARLQLSIYQRSCCTRRSISFRVGVGPRQPFT